jgi:hypothetical protein
MAKEQEPDSNDARVTTGLMLSVLRERQPDANRGALENLCDQGLLPPRARTGQEGRRPVWTYPFGADRQLRALMFWREATHDPDLLRVALWVDGYPVDIARVQRSIHSSIVKMVADVHRSASAAAPPNATEPERRRAFATQAARLRGKNTVAPRTRGVSADERINAVEALLDAFMFDQAGQASEETAMGIELLLGLQGAREPIPGVGADPWLTGSPSDIFEAATHVGLQHLLETAETATPIELDLVRPWLNALLVGLPIFAKLFSTIYGAKAGGFGAISKIGSQPQLPVLLVPTLISLHRAGQTEGLADLVATLNQGTSLGAGLLAAQDLTQKELEANLQNQPPKVAKAVRLVLQEAPFDDLETTLERQANDPITRRTRERRQP